jgi:glycosylphosphatidylinositol deacylase
MNDTSLLETKSSSNNNSINNQQPLPHLRIDRTDEVPLQTLNKKQSSRRTMSSPESSPSPPSSPSTSRVMLPRLYRMLKLSRLVMFLLILFSLSSIYIMLDSFQHHQRDVSGCQTSYMRPEYIKQTGFDSEMTRFAGKYGLYLYREKGVDFTDQASSLLYVKLSRY